MSTGKTKSHTSMRSPPSDDRSPGALPADFRPGRLSPMEILHRIFPNQKKAVMELVLQGCDGNLVKAIEHFLSANDAMLLHPPVSPYGFPLTGEDLPYAPRPVVPPLTLGSIKSAFTPLAPPAHATAARPSDDSTLFGSVPRLSESSLYVPYSLAQTSHLLLQPCQAGCLQCRRTFSLVSETETHLGTPTEDQIVLKEQCTRTQEAVDLSDRS